MLSNVINRVSQNKNNKKRRINLKLIERIDGRGEMYRFMNENFRERDRNSKIVLVLFFLLK